MNLPAAGKRGAIRLGLFQHPSLRFGQAFVRPSNEGMSASSMIEPHVPRHSDCRQRYSRTRGCPGLQSSFVCGPISTACQGTVLNLCPGNQKGFSATHTY